MAGLMSDSVSFSSGSGTVNPGAGLEGRIDLRLCLRNGAVDAVEIRSGRFDLARRLMRGRSPAEVAGLAGRIFSLCGRAQRLAAETACAAAAGGGAAQAVIPEEIVQVRVELALEHAWHLLRSRPAQADAAVNMAAMHALRRAAGERLRFADTLEQVMAEVLLGMPPAEWAGGDLGAFAAWCRTGSTPLATEFARLAEGADVGGGDCPLLPALADLDDASALELARLALEEADFCKAPRWRNQPAETGALSRMTTHPLLAAWIGRHGRGMGARLLARLLELAELLQHLRCAVRAGGHAGMVRAWVLAENVGLAGVETARGLLLHVARLEDGKVADYRIVAPTEWNFHPGGPLARALLGLGKPTDPETLVLRLCHSLDPCVAFGIELSDA